MDKPFTGFDWDDGNREKCCQHGLSVPEIEYVLAHQRSLIIPDVRHSVAEARFLAIGLTQRGRYAFVVFTPRQVAGQPLARPISARFMHRKEIETYEKEISRSEDR